MAGCDKLVEGTSGNFVHPPLGVSRPQSQPLETDSSQKTAEANLGDPYGTASNSPSNGTVRAGKSSNASTPKEDEKKCPFGTSYSFDNLSESSMMVLRQRWVHSTLQSSCTESIKSRDLTLIEFLPMSLYQLKHTPWVSLVASGLEVDDHFGRILNALHSEADKTGPISSKFFMKDGILHKKCKQKDQSEKIVVCLTDQLLPGIIHLMHAENAHPALAESRRIFEGSLFNRNADRMIKSYIKACDLCANTSATAPSASSPQGRTSKAKSNGRAHFRAGKGKADSVKKD